MKLSRATLQKFLPRTIGTLEEVTHRQMRGTCTVQLTTLTTLVDEAWKATTYTVK
jgi:hypothetical protein